MTWKEGQRVEVLLCDGWLGGFTFVRPRDGGETVVRRDSGELLYMHHDQVRAVAPRFDVLVWMRDRPDTLQRGEWLIAHPGVSQVEAIGLSAEARSHGERARIVVAGTQDWAQCFEVSSGPGRTIEACFWCELDAQTYVESLLRGLGVERCFTRVLWRASVHDESAMRTRTLRDGVDCVGTEP